MVVAEPGGWAVFGISRFLCVTVLNWQDVPAGRLRARNFHRLPGLLIEQLCCGWNVLAVSTRSREGSSFGHNADRHHLVLRGNRLRIGRRQDDFAAYAAKALMASARPVTFEATGAPRSCRRAIHPGSS